MPNASKLVIVFNAPSMRRHTLRRSLPPPVDRRTPMRVNRSWTAVLSYSRCNRMRLAMSSLPLGTNGSGVLTARMWISL